MFLRCAGQTASSCSVGRLYCCNSVISSTSTPGSTILALLGVIPDGNLMGLTCSPVTVIGIGDSSCSSQIVCCTGDNIGMCLRAVCSVCVTHLHLQVAVSLCWTVYLLCLMSSEVRSTFMTGIWLIVSFSRSYNILLPRKKFESSNYSVIQNSNIFLSSNVMTSKLQPMVFFGLHFEFWQNFCNIRTSRSARSDTRSQSA
ncbi:hypothetical protein SCHPADRAFT_829696 [Schizopora paradoxa]|uniref:Hydrophobin n=1 Tax=Schizopora paradoxa TaxID=27342 RepID=A0A0H2RKZ8_9AGAM|nr:hypothetical protein SCHPADRAFT_829696 [Schizopora paradoxa]